MAVNDKADIIVVGMHGRKGPKADPTVLGSAVQYMSLNYICPILIVKDRTLRADKKSGYRWAFCTDGSDKSFKCLEEIAKIIDHEKDTVIAITVKCVNMHIDKIKERAEESFKKLNVKGEFVELPHGDTVPPETIVSYLMQCATPETYIDFVAVGNQGADYTSHHDKKYLGSVASGVIRKSKLNVLFIA